MHLRPKRAATVAVAKPQTKKSKALAKKKASDVLKVKQKAAELVELEDELVLDDIENKTIIEIVHGAEDYLVRIDPRQHAKARPFRLACFYGELGPEKEGVPCKRNGRAVSINGFIRLNILFKADVYRSGKLMPRLSDADFMDKTDVDDGMDTGDDDQKKLAEKRLEITAQCGELQEHAESFVAYLREEKPVDVPIMVQMGGAKAMNRTMLQLLSMQNGIQSNAFSTNRNAALLMANCVATEVLEIFPPAWDAVAGVVDDCFEVKGMDLLAQHPAFLELAEDPAVAGGLCRDLVHCLRGQLTCHLVSCLGLQEYNHREGPIMVRRPYLPSMLQKVIAGVGSKFKLESSNVPGTFAATPRVFIDLIQAPVVMISLVQKVIRAIWGRAGYCLRTDLESVAELP